MDFESNRPLEVLWLPDLKECTVVDSRTSGRECETTEGARRHRASQALPFGHVPQRVHTQTSEVPRRSRHRSATPTTCLFR